MKITKLLDIDFPFVLASQSPRRKKLLEQIGLDFKIIPANINEDIFDDATDPEEHVKLLAAQKALAVAENLTVRSLVLGSDTIVVHDGKILNKPKDPSDAKRMLGELSGKTHIVYSGITIADSLTKKIITDIQKTYVTFRILSEREIDAYVETGAPLDKAGAYGIQDDFGAVFVSHIEGCYYNIVGLPLELFYVTLEKFLKEINEA